MIVAYRNIATNFYLIFGLISYNKSIVLINCRDFQGFLGRLLRNITLLISNAELSWCIYVILIAQPYDYFSVEVMQPLLLLSINPTMFEWLLWVVEGFPIELNLTPQL